MAVANLIFVGIKGSVVALDRATGTQVWITPLKGSEFVNVVTIDGDIYAGTKGQLFCLDPSTGHIRWHNPLKGLGYGLLSIATEGGRGNLATMAERRRREEAAAAAAAASAAS